MLIPAAVPGQQSLDVELTPEERRMRAMQYRQLAAGIVSGDVRNTLLQLAVRHESLARGEFAGDGAVGQTADQPVGVRR